LSVQEQIRRIAEIEFSSVVEQTDILGSKLRVLLTDSSYIDVWTSRTLNKRFGFHWERRHLDERFYRYDNFPDTNWSNVSTFPFHFHDGTQDAVISSPFATEPLQGFREFIAFVEGTIDRDRVQT
jgi:hypothetical protein